jgi:hypothetical protein
MFSVLWSSECKTQPLSLLYCFIMEWSSNYYHHMPPAKGLPFVSFWQYGSGFAQIILIESSALYSYVMSFTGFAVWFFSIAFLTDFPQLLSWKTYPFHIMQISLGIVIIIANTCWIFPLYLHFNLKPSIFIEEWFLHTYLLYLNFLAQFSNYACKTKTSNYHSHSDKNLTNGNDTVLPIIIPRIHIRAFRLNHANNLILICFFTCNACYTWRSIF